MIETDASALLTVAEIAARLRVTESTVRRWLREGQLRGVFLGDRAGYRVRPAELARFLAARENVAPEA